VDPLTHTLVGASLATTRLGRRTPLASAALLLGANLPDVDVLAYAWGEDFAIGFRRGWTHGVPALVVLPLLLTGLLLLWDRAVRRRRQPGLPSPRAPALLLISGLAVLTHPVLDWLNTYGMRWWMPFDGRWSYGDAVFIMDPWLWLMLGLPWLLTRRPTVPLLVGCGVLTLLLALVVAGRAPEYLVIVLACAAVLALALLRRPPAAQHHHRIAGIGLLAAGAYVVVMLAVQGVTAASARAELDARGWGSVTRLMAGPQPLTPWIRDIVAEVPQGYLHGRWEWLSKPHLRLEGAVLPPAQTSPLWPRVREHPGVQGYLSWVRFPWIAVDASDGGRRVLLLDARYAREPTTSTLGIEVR
jgi:inner membrane protein